MKLHMYEILEQVEKAESIKDKVKVLQDNESTALCNLLRGNYDSTIKWKLPVGKPPYTPNVNATPKTVHRMAPNLGSLTTFSKLKMAAWKYENTFIKFLENIHAKDAELFVQMKDKELKSPGLTLKLVKKAFPKLIDTPVEQ